MKNKKHKGFIVCYRVQNRVFLYYLHGVTIPVLIILFLHTYTVL